MTPSAGKTMNPKELADKLRRLGDDPKIGGFTQFDHEVIAALDELARIKAAAMPEKITKIADAWSGPTWPRPVFPVSRVAHEDILTLLDALRAMGAEKAGLFADGVKALKERDAARAEVERLKAEIADWKETVCALFYGFICQMTNAKDTLAGVMQEVGKDAREKIAEIDRLRAENEELKLSRVREVAQAQLDEFDHVRANRPIDSSHWDMHHRNHLVKNIAIASKEGCGR